MKKKLTGTLARKAVRQKLPALLERYLRDCRPPEGADVKKSAGRLPNLAGFLRSLDCGMADYEELREKDAPLCDRIRTVLEDEALNFSASSATVLCHYLKKRLGYGEDDGREEKQTECGPVRLIFDHDIEEDGG